MSVIELPSVIKIDQKVKFYSEMCIKFVTSI